VQAILSHITIRQAKIGDLKIRVDKSSFPTSATAYFTECVDARDNRGAMPYERITRKLKVTLHKAGEHWLLYNYTDTDVHNSGGASAPIIPARSLRASPGKWATRRRSSQDRAQVAMAQPALALAFWPAVHTSLDLR